MTPSLNRWLYRGGRPNALARFLNRLQAAIFARGVSPDWVVALDVVGRSSGRKITFPLVMAWVDGERYLVSMLGRNVAWVRNLEAAGGRAVLRHGKSEPVRLELVTPERRAPILQEYLRRAPGARPHIPVDPGAPLESFAAVAADYPVFRVVAYDGATGGES
ncbi:MAG TPA: nitroreductase/quinone reductase family protein [Myxococcota bacterium]|nr:nitroreductase/quinone reductase family protein [Myxococcota bacterium]